jgi:hypothetical protein
MAVEVKSRLGTYRLLHFQPDPEDGDRVCVALLVQDGDRYTILSDKKFPKLQCIAPSFEPELVRFYLEDLETGLRKSPGEIDFLLQRFVPQLLASEERRLSLPLSESQKFQLLERFVVGRRKRRTEEVAVSSSERLANEHLQSYVNEFRRMPQFELIRNAKYPEVFGKKMPAVKPVAIALRAPNKLVLVDGIDLRVFTPSQAVTKVNRTVHTFWQYGRLRKMDLPLEQKIERVGIVLNGTSPKTSDYLEAHDYAVDQFRRESDVMVDTTSGEGTLDFERILQDR